MNKHIALCILILLSFVGVSHSQSASAFKVTASDTMMAEAVRIRKQSGLDRELEFLQNQCKQSARGDAALDDAVFYISQYYLDTPESRKDIAAYLTEAQALRLFEKAQSAKSIHKQVLFGELLLNGALPGELLRSDRSLRANVMHNLAVAYALSDFTNEKALSLWEQMRTEFKDLPESQTADIFYEAMRFPHSIAGLEVLYRMAVLQNNIAGNNIAAMASNQKVMDACRKEFYTSYLASPHVPLSDKLQLQSNHLYSAYMGGDLDLAPKLAHDVLVMSKAQGKAAEEALMIMALCDQKLGHYQRAIDNYDLFIQAFPKSPKIAQVLLNSAMTEHSRGNFREAAAQYAVLAEMFPNSEEAQEARSRIIILKDLEDPGKWNVTASVQKRKDTVQANLNLPKPVDVVAVLKLQPASGLDIQTVTDDTPLPPTHLRLAEVLSQNPLAKY